MKNVLSEAHKLGLIPNQQELSTDELRKIIDTIDPDIMGFDGPEGIDDLDDYLDDVPMSPSGAISIGGGLTIVDNLTSVNYSNRTNSKKYLAFHFTAGTVDNGTAARANTNYFKSTYRGASAHYFVDKEPIIYRSVKDDFVAWHIGTSGKYYHSICRNSNCIGIEICSYAKNGVYYFNEQTVKNAIVLGKYLIKKYNIPKDNIVMHWHVTHKVCAAPFISNGKPTSRWDEFKNLLYDGAEPVIDANEFNAIGIVTNLNANDTLNVRSGPGTSYAKVGILNNGDRVTINAQNGNWYSIGPSKWVSASYIEIIKEVEHWCDSMKNELYDKGILIDNNIWYNKPTTKEDAVIMIARALGERVKENVLSTLINKNIITDADQWSDLTPTISKALYMALMVNMLGGVDEKYNDVTVAHWGEKPLKTLQDKGIINTPEVWNTDFDGQVLMCNAIALFYKVLNYKK